MAIIPITLRHLHAITGDHCCLPGSFVVNYKTFEKSVDRAGRALYTEDDAEKSLRILMTLIVKLQGKLKSYPAKPSVELRLACFCGVVCPAAAVVIHTTLARSFADVGDVKNVHTSIRQLLILYSYFTPKLYSHPDSPTIARHAQAPLRTKFQLPAELWREVAGWLSRPDWQTLLRVPHPLRQCGFELFFRDIYLHLDVYQSEQLEDHPQLKHLEIWQLQRTTEILRRITADSLFASRIRTLRISMRCGPIPDGVEHSEVLQFERCLLWFSLSLMRKLETLEVYGSHILFDTLIPILPRVSPRLRNITMIYDKHEAQTVSVKMPHGLAHLQRLSLYPPSIRLLCFEKVAEIYPGSLSTLRLSNPLSSISMSPSMAETLTHLELECPWDGLNAPGSLIETVLQHGGNLRVLQLRGYPRVLQHSGYFRQHPKSLPYLQRFVITFSPPLSYPGAPNAIVPDPDLFPSISDFIRGRPLLECLALNEEAGYPIQCFGFDACLDACFSTCPHLRNLSMTIWPTLGQEPIALSSRIPRSVRTFTMNVGCHLVLDMETMFRRGDWPEDLRFLAISTHGCQCGPLNEHDWVKKIAMSIPSIRVIRLNVTHFTVKPTALGKTPRIEEWSERATLVYRKETLEELGCEEENMFMITESALSWGSCISD